MPYDFEPRLLRCFAATAQTLHFTRAAERLHVAQQALSRDIRRLERDLGVRLFIRSTRSVRLTPEGERLVPYARRVLAAHDELAAAFAPLARPLLADVRAGTGTARAVLEQARQAAVGVEIVARFHSGLTMAADEIIAGRLDVSFGRIAGLDPSVRTALDHLPVRLEPMAVLLPDDHRLAPQPSVPLAALAGERLYAAAGNPATAEWTDLSEQLFAGRGIEIVEPFPEIAGHDEFVRLIRSRHWPVLTVVGFMDVPGCVLRPLTDPVPLSPVSMVWRRGLRHPGLDALRHAVSALASANAWLTRPPDSWLPEADARFMPAGHR